MQSKINAVATKKLTATGILFQVVGLNESVCETFPVAVPIDF